MDLSGQSIGSYKLLRLLGYGSSSCVYLGEHRYNGSYVAVKILHAHVGSQYLKRWDNETRILSLLNHSSTIRMYEDGMQDDLRFRLLEWAEQGSLLNLFAHDASLATVVLYIKQIASTLHYLHARHLIHGDVKPANILVRCNGTALLTDFELSQDYRRSENASYFPAYAAPEARRGEPCPASDQYALAAVVCRWLGGEILFRECLDRQIEPCEDDMPSALYKQISALPPAIMRVVFTALARDPHSRFPNIQMFVAALEEAARSVLNWRMADSKGDDPDHDGST